MGEKMKSNRQINLVKKTLFLSFIFFSVLTFIALNIYKTNETLGYILHTIGTFGVLSTGLGYIFSEIITIFKPNHIPLVFLFLALIYYLIFVSPEMSKYYEERERMCNNFCAYMGYSCGKYSSSWDSWENMFEGPTCDCGYKIGEKCVVERKFLVRE